MIILLIFGLAFFFLGALIVAGLLLLRDYLAAPSLNEVTDEFKE